jgi:hypothetical protein
MRTGSYRCPVRRTRAWPPPVLYSPCLWLLRRQELLCQCEPMAMQRSGAVWCGLFPVPGTEKGAWRRPLRAACRPALNCAVRIRAALEVPLRPCGGTSSGNAHKVRRTATLGQPRHAHRVCRAWTTPMLCAQGFETPFSRAG